MGWLDMFVDVTTAVAKEKAHSDSARKAARSKPKSSGCTPCDRARRIEQARASVPQMARPTRGAAR